MTEQMENITNAGPHIIRIQWDDEILLGYLREIGIPSTIAKFNPATDSESEEWMSKLRSVRSALQYTSIVGCLGIRGTGKTTFMHSLIRSQIITAKTADRLCSVHDVAKYCTLAEMVIQSRAVFTDNTMSENDFVNLYMRPDFLVIDQIETAKHSDYELNILEIILMKRFNWEKKTILGANNKIDDFVKIVGQNIYSRMLSDGIIVDFSKLPCFREKIR